MPSVDCFCCGPTKAGVMTAGLISLLGGINDIIFGLIILPEYDDGNWLHAISVVQGGLTTVSSCALMAGAWKEKSTLLLPYSTVMMLGVVTYFALGTTVLVMFDEKMLLDYGLWYYCWTGIVAYFLNVVRLYRIKILEIALHFQQDRDQTILAAAAIRRNSRANSRSSVSTILTRQPRRTEITTPSSSTNPTSGITQVPGDHPQPGTSSSVPPSAPTGNFQNIGWNGNVYPNDPPPSYSVVATPPPPYSDPDLPPYPGKHVDKTYQSKAGPSEPSAPEF